MHASISKSISALLTKYSVISSVPKTMTDFMTSVSLAEHRWSPAGIHLRNLLWMCCSGRDGDEGDDRISCGCAVPGVTETREMTESPVNVLFRTWRRRGRWPNLLWMCCSGRDGDEEDDRISCECAVPGVTETREMTESPVNVLFRAWRSRGRWPNLLWMCCSGRDGVKGDDRADRLAGRTTITNSFRLGRWIKSYVILCVYFTDILYAVVRQISVLFTDNKDSVFCSLYLEAWDTTCGHKAKGITPSIAWRREAWKEKMLNEYLPWKDERGPLPSQSDWWTLVPFQRQETSERRGGAFMGFFERIDTIFNWTELT